MILDTSAVVAIVTGEPGAAELEEAILAADAVRMSAATLVELNAVLGRRLSPQAFRRVQRLLAVWQVEVVAFDAEHAEIASRGYADFGRGSAHPAKLNLGDCFAYGLAIARDEPLLFTGKDFTHTDVESATASM